MTDLFEKPVGLQSFEFAKLGSCEVKECLCQSLFKDAATDSSQADGNAS